jgi:hypothetical protein
MKQKDLQEFAICMSCNVAACKVITNGCTLVHRPCLSSKFLDPVTMRVRAAETVARAIETPALQRREALGRRHSGRYLDWRAKSRVQEGCNSGLARAACMTSRGISHHRPQSAWTPACANMKPTFAPSRDAVLDLNPPPHCDCLVRICM